MLQTTYGLVGAVDRERLASRTLENPSNIFVDSPHIRILLDSVPSIYLILNESNEIVFANQALYRFIGSDLQKPVLGLSACEALHCMNSKRKHGILSDNEHCIVCGIQRALAKSSNGKQAVQDGYIVRDDGEAVDLRIWATPFKYHDKYYSLLSISDISHEKRRYALERKFFKDVLDTAVSVQGFGQLMQDVSTDVNEDMASIVTDMSTQLVDDIRSQQAIASAENGNLAINMATVNSHTILKELVALYRYHDKALDRRIRMDPESTSIEFDSDPKLVRQVLGNMILNALEATEPGQTVSVACRSAANCRKVEFTVHNPQIMPSKVQLRVFHRSFSTKGVGRGLGAYSMKMLTERYLQGKLSILSTEESGTTFSVRYPRRMLPTWIVAK